MKVSLFSAGPGVYEGGTGGRLVGSAWRDASWDWERDSEEAWMSTSSGMVIIGEGEDGGVGGSGGDGDGVGGGE